MKNKKVISTDEIREIEQAKTGFVMEEPCEMAALDLCKVTSMSIPPGCVVFPVYQDLHSGFGLVICKVQTLLCDGCHSGSLEFVSEYQVVYKGGSSDSRASPGLTSSCASGVGKAASPMSI